MSLDNRILDKEMLEEYRSLRDEIRKKIFSHLNPQQMRAAETGEGPVLCLAGAGSGKTTAMVNRVLHLYLFGSRYNPQALPPVSLSREDLGLMRIWLEEKKPGDREPLPWRLVRLINSEGVNPHSILAITFTNKAAEEMQNRLELLLGRGAMRDMWAMNFHKACMRILRREIEKLGYTSNFTIYDDQDQQQVIKAILSEMNIDDKKFPPRAISSLISRFKSELKNPQDAGKEALDYWQEKGLKVYEMYQKRLKQNNALDFDDIIMLTVELFKKDPDVLVHYQERFKYILVDEYQDTNHAQYKLVDKLAQKHHNLFVVGDDDQSIYAFRQADIRNILDFEKDYPKAKIIKLEENYRSTGLILEAANEVIRNNRGRKDKRLWTKNPQGSLIIQYRAQDEQDEARFITEQIADLCKKGARCQDCAVLLRTNAQSRVLEEWFMKKGIPYRIVGGQKFYERKEIKDILAYLKFLANPYDTISLQRVINVPRRGIGDATIQKVAEYAAVGNLTLYQALEQHAAIQLTPKAARAIAGLAQLLERFISLVDGCPVTVLTEKILEETGYALELQQENTIEALSRLENLKEFLTVTKEYDDRAEEPTLSDFLSQVSLVSELDTYADTAEAVVIMTVHMAKGLEFTNVFLAGMEEGIFPHSRSVTEEEVEEERRLCYVALTRARERVYLTYARLRNLYGRSSYNMPSRFLGEIPPNLWEEYSGGGFFKTTLAPPSPVRNRNIDDQRTRDNSSLVLGDKVEHSKWGQGVIVSVRGQGDDQELQVAFPGQGIKTLIAKFAPLKKVN